MPPVHAANPAIVVGGFALHVVDDFRVGQDQERLLVQALYHRLGDIFGLQHAVTGGCLDLFTAGIVIGHSGHRGPHGLGAQHRHPDAPMAVSQGQPFTKANRCVLGYPIGGAADLVEQSGCRSGMQEVAAAALGHSRNEMTGRIDMGHDVDFPAGEPLLVGRLLAGAQTHPGVTAKQVDGPDLIFGLCDDPLDIGFTADIRGHGKTVTHGRRFGNVVGVDVHRDNLNCPLCDKPLHEGPANTAAGAGDHHNLFVYLHVPDPIWVLSCDSTGHRSTLALG